MTTAIVPFKPQVIDAGPSAGASARQLKAQAKFNRMAMVDRVLEKTTSDTGEILKKLLGSPIMIAVGGVAITNILSQTETGTYQGAKTYVLTGAQAVALQTAILTPTFLNSLAEATKPALDIAQLVKLVGAL